MACSLKLAMALLLVSASLLSACAAPRATPAPPVDGGGRQARAPDGQGAAAVAGEAPADAESPAATGRQPAPPEVTAPIGLDVGQRAPSFTIAGLDGRQISDADLRAQGKPYILYFYATW